MGNESSNGAASDPFKAQTKWYSLSLRTKWRLLGLFMPKAALAYAHRAHGYVGPKGEFDLMGGRQFRLCFDVGLRAHHSLLDVGCGNLRAGRLIIPYLNEGMYCGIEPNRLLVDMAAAELGTTFLKQKAARFSYNDDFDTTVFGQQFDFILAQSIFSHTSLPLMCRALESMRKSIAPDGVIVFTYMPAPEGEEECTNPAEHWYYPGSAKFRGDTIGNAIKRVAPDLFFTAIPGYHPVQQWIAATPSREKYSVIRQHRHNLAGVAEYTQLWGGAESRAPNKPACDISSDSEGNRPAGVVG